MKIKAAAVVLIFLAAGLLFDTGLAQGSENRSGLVSFMNLTQPVWLI